MKPVLRVANIDETDILIQVWIF